jgi:hypothetical protein
MSKCECCGKERADARARRVSIREPGKSPQAHFDGIFCDECIQAVSDPDSPARKYFEDRVEGLT